MLTKSRVAMNSDVSKTDESNGRRSSWTPTPLLPGVWVCLGFAFVWLVWNTYNMYDVDHLLHTISDAQRTRLIWSLLLQQLPWPPGWVSGMLSQCRRHHRRLLSSMQRSEHEHTEIALPRGRSALLGTVRECQRLCLHSRHAGSI